MDPLADFLASAKVRVVIPDSQESCERLQAQPALFTRIPNRETLHHGEEIQIFVLILSQEASNNQYPNIIPTQEVPQNIRSLFGQIHIFIEGHASNSKYNDHRIGSPPSCTSACSFWALEPESTDEAFIISSELGSERLFDPTISQRSGCFPAWIPSISSRTPTLFTFKNEWAAMFALKVKIGSGKGFTGHTRLHLGYVIGRPKQPHLPPQQALSFSDHFILNSASTPKQSPSSLAEEDSDIGVIDCDQRLLRQFMDPAKVFQHIVFVSPQLSVTIPRFDNVSINVAIRNTMRYAVELTQIALVALCATLDMLAASMLPIKLLPGEEAQFVFRVSGAQPVGHDMRYLDGLTAELWTASKACEGSTRLTYQLSLTARTTPAFSQDAALRPEPSADTFSMKSKSSTNSIMGRVAKGITSLLPSFHVPHSTDSQPNTGIPHLLSEELLLTLQAEENVLQGHPCRLCVTLVNQSSRPRNVSLFFVSSKPASPVLVTKSCLHSDSHTSVICHSPWELSPELVLKRYTAGHCQEPSLISPQMDLPLPVLHSGTCLTATLDVISLSHNVSPVSSLWLVDNDLNQSIALPHLEILPLPARAS